MFDDPEVGTEAHDDLVAWCASGTGSNAIVQGTVALYFTVGEFITLSKREQILSADKKISIEPKMEVPLGAPNFVKGFADVLLLVSANYEVGWTETYETTSYPREKKTVETSEKRRVEAKILVEVKTGQVKLGEILRQMNTYEPLAFGFKYNFGARVLIVKQNVPAHYLEAFSSERIKVGQIDETYALEWLNDFPLTGKPLSGPDINF